jgi:hypothetical protein
MLIFLSGKSLQKLISYEIFLIIIVFMISNLENIVIYLKGVDNPNFASFDPINRLLSTFPTYVFESTPRRLAYTEILPRILVDYPVFGLGVTSVLNQQSYFLDSPVLRNALYYVYGDVGIVRLFVEYGVLGAFIYLLLFINVFKHAQRHYLYLNPDIGKAFSYATMLGIIILIPISLGTMSVLSKSYGLYLWMFIGFSQRWHKK